MKRFISILLLAMMLLTAVPFSSFSISAADKALPFTDVKETDWFYEAVDYTYANGIFKGTNSAGTLFSPSNAMTRAQFATTLFRLSGANEADYQGESLFPDVPSNDWMTAAVNWASEKGYVEGNNKGEFMPSKTLNRQTLATMLYRYAKDEYDTSKVRQTAFDRFGDASDTADWAKEAMTWMVTVELINGTGANVKGAPTLAPAKTATRAQVAKILMSYSDLWYDQPYNVGDILIGGSSISDYTIVYSSRYAELAADFAKYLNTATGFELDAVCDTDCEIGEKEILIGMTNREGVTVNVDRSVCTDRDTILIEVQNGNLILTSDEAEGDLMYGTTYAAYDFLEHFAGISFLDDTTLSIDVKKAYSVPSDYYLCETSATTGYRVFSAHYNCEQWKMHEINEFTGFYHSLPSLSLDPSEFEPSWSFQAEHHKNADPCLTNPAIQQNIITNAGALASNGKDGVWVAMSDAESYCKCNNCAAYYRVHGRMGTYFNILDVVADALEKDYPDTQIVGLAYKYIWSMLKGFDRKDINKNVAMFICTDNMCGTHSITSTGCKNESNPNDTYEKDFGYKVETIYGYKDCFDKIVELCPNLYVWDYTYPANHDEQPLPFFHRMYDNYTYFFKNGVKGMFRQNTLSKNSSFGYLRNYMAAQLLRDGNRITEAEYWARLDEYLKEYYGDGWTYIREYIDYTYELSLENEWHIWSNEDWNDVITEEQYRENYDYLMGLWEKASSLAQTEDMKYRVERDSTQMKFIEVCLAYETYADSAMTDTDLKAYTDVRDAYIETLTFYGLNIPNIANMNPAQWKY